MRSEPRHAPDPDEDEQDEEEQDFEPDPDAMSHSDRASMERAEAMGVEGW